MIWVIARQQTLVQLSEELVAALDQRAARRGVSRSRLIREAIQDYLMRDADAAIDAAIVDGYTRIPQEDDPWAYAEAIESIRAEPW
jgi:metal-responsive CopG/Arc/MetJ family transcriptional regulator